IVNAVSDVRSYWVGRACMTANVRRIVVCALAAALRAGAAAAESEAPSPALATLGTWTFLGPDNVGGRTRALAFHPDFASNHTAFAGSASGGVWRTTDAGATWAPIGDSFTNLSVNALALAPGAPETIYAGTGEGFGNPDAVRGDGIFKSTDGGNTWTQLVQ